MQVYGISVGLQYKLKCSLNDTREQLLLIRVCRQKKTLILLEFIISGQAHSQEIARDGVQKLATYRAWVQPLGSLGESRPPNF